MPLMATDILFDTTTPNMIMRVQLVDAQLDEESESLYGMDASSM